MQHTQMKDFSCSYQACKYKLPNGRQHSDYTASFIIFYPLSYPTKEQSGFPLQKSKVKRADLTNTMVSSFEELTDHFSDP